MFGAQLAPVTKEVRDRQKLDGDDGVVLEKVFPGTSAADADFKAGDVILAIGGAKVTGIPVFLEKMAKARAGDVLTLDVVRDGVKAEKRVTLKEMPREKGDGYDVIYSSVTSHGARLRTIVTRPKARRAPPGRDAAPGRAHVLLHRQSGRPHPSVSPGSPATWPGMATSRCGSSGPAAATARAVPSGTSTSIPSWMATSRRCGR